MAFLIVKNNGAMRRAQIFAVLRPMRRFNVTLAMRAPGGGGNGAGGKHAHFCADCMMYGNVVIKIHVSPNRP